MEPLLGGNLHRLLEEMLTSGSPGYPEARYVKQILTPLLRAIRACHKLRVQHNNLKPTNVALTESGTLKIMDIGCPLPRITGELSWCIRSLQYIGTLSLCSYTFDTTLDVDVHGPVHLVTECLLYVSYLIVSYLIL